MSIYRKFLFNKLGRDGVLEKWTREGVKPKTVHLNDAAFTHSLLEKLKEETQEVVEHKNPTELKEELADVIEIVRQIAKNAGISMEDIEKARADKFAKWGGWDKRLFVEWAEFPEGHPTIDYCLKNPDRFPEIVE